MSAATTSAAGRLTDAELKAQEKAARKAEKARQKRIAADEAAERKRSAKAGFANVNNPRRSTLLTVLCAVFAVYCLFPFVYLLINATKTQADFTSTFGLGFGKTFALFDNIATVFSYQDGIFARWLFNTILYVVVGAGGATLLAIMGGYASGEVPLPGPQRGVRGHHRRDQRAGHRFGGPPVPPVRQIGPDEHPVGHDYTEFDQPVRPVPDVDLQRAGRAPGAAGGRPRGRRLRVPHVLADQPARCWLRASLRRPCSRSWRRGTTTSCR